MTDHAAELAKITWSLDADLPPEQSAVIVAAAARIEELERIRTRAAVLVDAFYNEQASVIGHCVDALRHELDGAS